jgi:uncharacterized protein involved in exopolysaccharide biosynthesis
MQTSPLESPPPNVSLLNYLHFLRKYSFFLFLFTFFGVFFTALLLWFVITPMYQAETSLLLMKNRPGGVSALLQKLEGNLDMLGSLQNLGIQANRSVEQDLISVLKSRHLTNLVQTEVPALRSLPEFQSEMKLSASQEASYSPEEIERYFEHQISEVLQEQVLILPPDTRHTTLRIRAELSDPVLTVRLVDAYIKHLQAFMETLLNEEENEQLNYLRVQTETLQKELTAAENELLAFQQKNQTVVLEEEMKQQIKGLAEIEAQLLTAEAAYKDTQGRQAALSQSMAELAPESTLTRNELDLNLAGLQQRRLSLKKAEQSYSQSLKTLPLQALQLARLQRQVSMKNQLFLLLKQQTEATALDQVRQFKAFRILDRAQVPFEPAKPFKPLWLALSAMLSFSLALLLSLAHQNRGLLKSPR